MVPAMLYCFTASGGGKEETVATWSQPCFATSVGKEEQVAMQSQLYFTALGGWGRTWRKQPRGPSHALPLMQGNQEEAAAWSQLCFVTSGGKNSGEVVSWSHLHFANLGLWVWRIIPS